MTPADGARRVKCVPRGAGGEQRIATRKRGGTPDRLVGAALYIALRYNRVALSREIRGVAAVTKISLTRTPQRIIGGALLQYVFNVSLNCIWLLSAARATFQQAEGGAGVSGKVCTVAGRRDGSGAAAAGYGVVPRCA